MAGVWFSNCFTSQTCSCGLCLCFGCAHAGVSLPAGRPSLSHAPHAAPSPATPPPSAAGCWVAASCTAPCLRSPANDHESEWLLRSAAAPMYAAARHTGVQRLRRRGPACALQWVQLQLLTSWLQQDEAGHCLHIVSQHLQGAAGRRQAAVSSCKSCRPCPQCNARGAARCRTSGAHSMSCCPFSTATCRSLLLLATCRVGRAAVWDSPAEGLPLQRLMRPWSAPCRGPGAGCCTGRMLGT